MSYIVYGAIKRNPTKDQDINKDHLLTVHMVSSYHYILMDPGKLYHTKGKSNPCDMYSQGCSLIDHGSGCMSIKHQLDINATETVKSKLIFEREDKSQGVIISVYHTQN